MHDFNWKVFFILFTKFISERVIYRICIRSIEVFPRFNEALGAILRTKPSRKNKLNGRSQGKGYDMHDFNWKVFFIFFTKFISERVICRICIRSIEVFPRFMRRENFQRIPGYRHLQSYVDTPKKK